MEFTSRETLHKAPSRPVSRFTVAATSLLQKEKVFYEKEALSLLSKELNVNTKTNKKNPSPRLKKNVIHGSLENLNKINNDTLEWKNKKRSPNNDKLNSPPVTCGNGISSNFMEISETHSKNIYDDGEDAGSYSTGPIDKCADTESEVLVSKNDINCCGGGDFNKVDSPQPPHSNNLKDLEQSETDDDDNDDNCDRQNLTNASSEIELLTKQLKDQRKKWILCKILYVVVFKALKKRSLELSETEKLLIQRKEECAARLILHHLLLNSWKTTKAQATAIACENAQMHKTIDNQSLQLNIIRKMQSIEKQKTEVVLSDYNEIKKKYQLAVQENETIKEEYAKVLGEKRCLEGRLETLRDENSKLNVDLRIRLDKKEMQLRSMELDRLRAEKFYQENELLQRESEACELQIKELTQQQAHWQEKAMQSESKCFELKMEMQQRLESYEEALNDNKEFAKENEILRLSKSKLEDAVNEANIKLEESAKHKQELEDAYTKCRNELEDLEDHVRYLQCDLRNLKKENSDIKAKLYNLTFKNIRRRRVWGAALYFFVNPIEAFKRLYFGSPVHTHSALG